MCANLRMNQPAVSCNPNATGRVALGRAARTTRRLRGSPQYLRCKCLLPAPPVWFAAGMVPDAKFRRIRPARLIRLPDVIARVGIKRSMIYRLMGEGRFPKSRSLGPKCAVWVEAEINQWIEELTKSET